MAERVRRRECRRISEGEQRRAGSAATSAADRGERGDRAAPLLDARTAPRDDGRDRNGVERGNGADERIAMDVLPPAIGREESADDERRRRGVSPPAPPHAPAALPGR